MNIYLLLENAAARCDDPDDLEDIVLGVFSAQKNADDCLQQHASYIYSERGIELFFEDGKAYDESGYLFLEIIERYIQ